MGLSLIFVIYTNKVLFGKLLANSTKMCYTYSALIGFDNRGSTIAITDMNGTVTDTFAYDTYGKCISRTGTSTVIFGYNGRDGVITDRNGLIYMRARYYSPEMRRFINADIVAGEIANGITLNRYAYANGNPVAFVDPMGLSAWSWFKEKVVDPFVEHIVEPAIEIGQDVVDYIANDLGEDIAEACEDVKDAVVDAYKDTKEVAKKAVKWVDNNVVKPVEEGFSDMGDKIGEAKKYASYMLSVATAEGLGTAINWVGSKIDRLAKYDHLVKLDGTKPSTYMTRFGEAAPLIGATIDALYGSYENIKAGEDCNEIVSDAMIDIGGGVTSVATTWGLAKLGTLIAPGWGTAIGLGVGFLYDRIIAPKLDQLL